MYTMSDQDNPEDEVEELNCKESEESSEGVESDEDETEHSEEELSREELEEKVESLEEENAIINSRLDHIAEYMDTVKEDFAELQEEYKNTQEQMSDMKDMLLQEKNINLSASEKLMCGKDWDDIQMTKSANRVRALQIIQGWGDDYKTDKFAGEDGWWGFKLTKLRDIKKWDYQTTKRVAKQIQKMTDGKIAFREEDKSKKLVKHKSTRLIDDKDKAFNKF